MTRANADARKEPVFHSGELFAQDRAGVDPSLKQRASHAIRPFMPDQHRQFFSQLPFMLVGARDVQGRPWASMLSGQPGFVTSPDPEHLVLASTVAHVDALAGRLGPGSQLGLLGIELHTRRRNRLNGTVQAFSDDEITVRVDQSFGNCPQYITPRQYCVTETDSDSVAAITGSELTAQARQWIESADTLFVASGTGQASNSSASQGMDVSHRGGPVGFVRVVNEHQLILPDYSGNQFFNTIGNLVVDPGIGLLFVDFERGSLLQLTGRASIDWGSEAISQFSGAQRLIQIDIDQVVQLDNALALRWDSAGKASCVSKVAKNTR